MAGQPKTPFYLVMLVVVAGLVAFAAYRWSDLIVPKAKPAPTGWQRRSQRAGPSLLKRPAAPV